MNHRFLKRLWIYKFRSLRYSAQIWICFIAYIIQFPIPLLVRLGTVDFDTARVPSAIVSCQQNEATDQTISQLTLHGLRCMKSSTNNGDWVKLTSTLLKKSLFLTHAVSRRTTRNAPQRRRGETITKQNQRQLSKQNKAQQNKKHITKRSVNKASH